MATVQLPQTLDDNLQAYCQSALAMLDPGTVKNTLSKLRRFLDWAVSCGLEVFTTWRDITPIVLDRFCAHRLQTPSARGFQPGAETIKRDLFAIKDFLVWNEERELTGPIRSAHAIRPLPRQEKNEVHCLTIEQETLILTRSTWIHEGGRGLRFPCLRDGKPEMHNARQTGWRKGAFRLYFLLMVRQGLRPSEALHLRWDEVFFDANPPILKLKRIEGEGEDSVRRRKLKTAKSEDAVTIARYVRPADRDHWSGPCEGVDLVAELRDFKAKAAADGTLGDWVFGWFDEFTQQPEYPDDAFIWRALKHETGDEKLKAYSCRHTLGTRLASRGYSYEEIARVLRNTARVAERYYVAGTRTRDAFDVATGQRLQVKLAAG